MDARRTETDYPWGLTNLDKEWLNRWVSPSQPGDGKHQVVTITANNNTWIVSSLWVQNATFLRISNATLNYTLPDNWISHSGFIKNCNIYFSIQNLALFTKYRGANPEGQSSSVSSTLAPGWDSDPYPLARVTSIGINLSF